MGAKLTKSDKASSEPNRTGPPVYLFANLEKAKSEDRKPTKNQINILFHKILNKMKSFSKDDTQEIKKKKKKRKNENENKKQPDE